MLFRWIRLLTTTSLSLHDHWTPKRQVWTPVIVKLPFENVSKYKFKHAKQKWGIAEKVHIHHIIPRQFRSHPVLSGYDVENGYNFMLMPNRYGKAFMRTTRPCHEGGHGSYNRYVGSRLEHIYRNLDKEDHYLHVRTLSRELRHRTCNDQKLPWV